jgi:hypothetical protein
MASVKVELSARADCMSDLIAIMREVAADVDVHGHLREVHLTTRAFFDADLRIVFSTGDSKEMIKNMHAAIRKFTEILEEAEDCHVIAESLNFTKEYDEERMDSSLEERIIAHLAANTEPL